MIWKTLVLFVVFLACAGALFASEIVIESGASWKTSKQFSEGWYETSFDDSLWVHAHAPSRGTCTFRADPIFFASPMWAPFPKAKEFVFFRKTFEVDSPIKKATLKASFDDDGEVYVNGTLVFTDASKKLEEVPFEADVTSLLSIGMNSIAMRGFDSFGGCQWAQAYISITSQDGQTLNVPLIKQDDPLWSTTEYDHASKTSLFCGTTIGECGCALTSLAMVLTYHGVKTTPNTLNAYFNQGAICSSDGCISQGYVYGNVRWNAVNAYSREAHDMQGSPKVQLVSAEPYSADLLRSDLVEGKPVVLKSPNTSHWFVGTGIFGDSFFINDPLFTRTQLDDPAYTNSSAAMRRYEVVHSDFSLIEAFIKAPGHLLITDMYGRRSGYDLTTGAIVQEIPQSYYLFEESYSLHDDPQDGVRWLFIQLPEGGTYTIASQDDEPFALYVADRDAQEKFEHYSEKVKINYDPNTIEELEINPTTLLACLL